MKKDLFAWLFACSLLSACSDKSETPVLHVSSNEFTWDATVREQVLTVATPTKWVARSNVNWCKPMKVSGETGTEVRLWVSPNLTKEARSGTLTISSGGQVKVVNLKQPAYTGDVDSYEYVLPVVFHVLYKDETDEKQNVREGWLASLLERVNKLYKNNHIGVTFEMAAYDQDGVQLEEAGVMRHKVASDSFDPSDFLMGNGEAHDLVEYGQNLRRFINVYVYRFSDDAAETGGQTLGISDMPMTTTEHRLDSLYAQPDIENYTHMSTPWGVCINNEEIYTLTDRYYYKSDDVSVTLAHELGHYLGLLHAFSEVGCLYDDACSDTPISDYTAYQERIEQLMEDYSRSHSTETLTLDLLATRDNCQEAGQTFVADNIMDYFYCYSNVLTSQQRARIRYVLNYAPMVPGPKLVDYGVGTTTRATSEMVRRLSHCPSKPVSPVIVAP